MATREEHAAQLKSVVQAPVVGRRVLVVDDDPDIRFVMRRMLEPAGIDVDDVASAEECLSALEAGALPDLVLLDLTLPGNSGWSVLNAIRAEQRYAVIDVIIVSGRDDDQFREAAKRAGVAHYITKPFTRWELIDAIERRPPLRGDAWGHAL